MPKKGQLTPTVPLSIRIPLGLRKAMDAHAKKVDRSLTSIIIEMLAGRFLTTKEAAK